DRFVAVKALGVVGNSRDLPAITNIANNDQEGRVALEAAASLIRLGDNRGLELLRSAIDNPQIEYLRMEAFLALAEFHGTELAPSCAELLAEYASSEAFVGDEVRQAAIWGLGKDGLRDYLRLLEFLDVPSDEERVHAVCAFGPELNAEIADALAAILTNPDSSDRKIAGASYILAKIVPAQLSIPRLVQARKHPSQRAQHWAIATLGQMNPTSIRLHIKDAALAAELVPFQLTSEESNWTRSEQVTEMLAFVRKQTIVSTT
ncbi:MAG TPA: HEAT repeat domain-containing protein, partial [Verrucomicrobiae bacterium]|nr:HEAT repeat domain-containing protein [Verrucomicrobiae bacterium]